MIQILAWIAVAMLALAGLGVGSLWAAGRFAKRRRGRLSSAIPPGGDTSLDALLGPFEHAHPAQSGARLIQAETEALALRLAMARMAARSLDLMYYIWDDDLSGRLLAGAVLAAADRGVRVRLLLDDVNVLNHDPIYRAIDRHPRIEVRLFNPIRTRDRSILRGLEILFTLLPYNRRMHNKLWLTDGRLGLTGGRNIGDAYFGVTPARGVEYDDLDVLLAGPVLGDLAALFDAFWNSGLALPIRTLWQGKNTRLRRFRTRLARYLADPATHQRLMQIVLPPEDDDLAVLGLDGLRWTARLRFVADPPEKSLGAARDGWLPGALLPILRAAQHDLRIVTPYFVPGTEGMAELVALRRRGVQVEIITNGLGLADNLLVYGAYRWYRARLLMQGIRIVEVAAAEGPPKMLHAKAFVVDGRQAFVGSFNFDLRSAFLNTELGVVFEDPQLVADLAAIVDQACAPERAWRVTLDGRLPRWSRGNDAGTHLEPESTTLKRAVTFVIGHLPIHRFL